MRSLIHIILLAVADYRKENLLSLCSILGLTAVLAPLLILYGVKFGIMTTLNERLLSNPTVMEISPIISGSFSKADFDEWRSLNGVSFVQPRTRSLAATMYLISYHDNQSTSTVVSLEPTAAGDPLFLHYNVQSVTMVPYTAPKADDETKSEHDAAESAHDAAAESKRAQPNAAGTGGLSKVPEVMSPSLREAGCVLSQTAAEKLGVHKGDYVLGCVGRSNAGVVSRAYVRLHVTDILPLPAQQKPTAYIPFELMLATEDFRDHRETPELGAENGWTGDKRPAEERLYPSFRLYASSLDQVTVLRDYFAAKHIDTYTHAEEIEQLNTLERGLTLIFTLVCATAAVGFFLSTISSVFASIKRKERILGLLQLTGFSPSALVLFPITQAVLTALLGSASAIVTYLGFSTLLNHLFAGAMGGTDAVCRLLPLHFLLATLLATGLSFLASLGPAIRSTRIEPSEVIRDV